MPRGARLRAALGGAIRRKAKTILYTDLTAQAASQGFSLGLLPAHAIVIGWGVDVAEGFAGIAGPTVDLGRSGGFEYVDDQAIDTSGAFGRQVAVAESGGSGVEATATVAVSQGNVSGGSAGRMVVSVLYVEPGETGITPFVEPPPA